MYIIQYIKQVKVQSLMHSNKHGTLYASHDNNKTKMCRRMGQISARRIPGRILKSKKKAMKL